MAITYSNKTGPSRKYFMNLPLGVRPTIGLSVQDRLLLAPANCLIQDLIDLDAPPNFYLWIIKKWYQKILQYDVELYLIITDMFCEIAGPVDVAPLNFTTPSSSPLSAYTAVFPRPNNTDWGSYGNTTGYFYGWACPIYNPITSGSGNSIISATGRMLSSFSIYPDGWIAGWDIRFLNPSIYPPSL